MDKRKQESLKRRAEADQQHELRDVGALCLVCEDTRWVCEDHPDKAWDGVSNSDSACKCGGAGMPCLECDT